MAIRTRCPAPDPLEANGILKLLLNLQQIGSVAYLFISHDIATVRSIADSIAVMYCREVVRYGARSEVLSPQFDAYADLLMSSVPEMEPGWLETAVAGRKMASAGNQTTGISKGPSQTLPTRARA